MERAFCRYCQDNLPHSKKEEKCVTCGRSSLPLTEEGISILPRDTQNLRTKGAVIILDVRWPDEVRSASIAGSVRIPLNQLEKRIKELPRDKQIVVHCHHGSRSRFATIMLLCHGFPDVRNMAGGIDAWSREIDPSVPRY